MKKLLFIAFALITFFAGCKNADDKQMETQSKVRFTSTSDYPYKISVDNVAQGSVAAHKFTEVYVNPGVHIFTAEQMTGYVLYPSVVSITHNCIVGIEFEFVFP